MKPDRFDFATASLRRAMILMVAMAAMLPTIRAAEPDGYYDSCEGRSGAGLLSQLQTVVGSHTALSYDALWTAFQTTDADDSGKIIDMYSTKRWNKGERCGNYKRVGDCYNREHSFPKSWFNDAKPMYTDLFHLYPTDGKVNGQRSNLPFGECAAGTYEPSNNGVSALGKKGSSTFPGYTGTVFEPDDRYKGDFARSYFYMAACYNSRISSWSSDMLNGTAYPAFSSWAVDLLLKWHRNDPVDEKERKRNEAVYARQHNRNPFIDHPDLAEHIWGEAKATPWHISGGEPAILKPVDGSTIDLGYASVNLKRSFTIDLMTSAIEGDVSVSVAGTGFSVAPATIPASVANMGGAVTVSVSHDAPGRHTGVLTVSADDLVSRVSLAVTTVEGIGANITRISDEGFDVTWINVDGPDALYEIHVLCGGEEVDGFPEAVDASDEAYTVTGLEPSTRYSCYFLTPAGPTPAIEETTAEAVPFINVVTPGDLDLMASPGEASDPIELTVESAYIDGDILVEASAVPFEVSSDKTTWGRTATLKEGENRFWLRVGPAQEGHYDGVLRAGSGMVVWEGDMTADVTSGAYFLEDFEPDGGTGTTYIDGRYEGSAAVWTFTDISNQASNAASGSRALVFGKKATSAIEMAEDLTRGAGVVSFQAKNWHNGNDPAATLHLEYSRDGGISWTEAAKFEVSETAYKEFSARVNEPAPVRLRLRQSAGKRLHLDDFAVTPVSVAGMDEVMKGRDGAWDAYCSGGRLVIENHLQWLRINVYSVSGQTLYSASPAIGLTAVDLAPGLYIVATDTYSRRVLVH